MGDRVKTVMRAACALLLVAAAACGGSGSSESSPIKFDIGSNNPGIVVAFGDSISDGYDSENGMGYRDDLESLFAGDGRNYIRVLDEGEPGTVSEDGAERIDAVLARDRPAALVLLYGTNDEFLSLPKLIESPGTTSGNLRQIIHAARANKTIVAVSTIPPVCGNGRQFQRNNIIAMNARIRDMVRGMQAVDDGIFLADAWDAFLRKAPPDGCSLIKMPRGNHPTEAGYAVLAETYFDALFYARW